MISELSGHIAEATGWRLTERGLYRTVKRLQDSGLLSSEELDAPRTGAKRKVLVLTALGFGLLSGIDANLIDLPGRNAPTA
ncbi:helix-turn-helix transcriptional regulator [Paramicrobacterium fandaimingii]|uniref:helix-turn-helix transcriptional regulator n=1 Tax=Paramicrobacterium fandaimingii TaxID=2708079 RepID=UPI001423C21C|nr:helix-turn-helix transcriptional regulator [Microbacterium fandaimingii]